MSDAPAYPQDDEINAEWTSAHVAIVLLSTLVIWLAFYFVADLGEHLTSKLFCVVGLNINIIGVVMASLKAPFFGRFDDGGKLDNIRANVEQKYFKYGMWFIALGFFLQALGALA